MHIINEEYSAISPKILDTSVIIDGRINGLLSCGLLEGQLIVAQALLMSYKLWLTQAVTKKS